MDMRDGQPAPSCSASGTARPVERSKGPWGHVHAHSWDPEGIEEFVATLGTSASTNASGEQATESTVLTAKKPIDPHIRHIAQISEHDCTAHNTTLYCQPIVTSIQNGHVNSHMEVFRVTRRPEGETITGPTNTATQQFMSEAFRASYLVSLRLHGHVTRNGEGKTVLTNQWEDAPDSVVRSVLSQGWIAGLEEIAKRYNARREADKGSAEGEGKVDSDVTFIELAKPAFGDESVGPTMAAQIGRLDQRTWSTATVALDE